MMPKEEVRHESSGGTGEVRRDEGWVDAGRDGWDDADTDALCGRWDGVGGGTFERPWGKGNPEGGRGKVRRGDRVLG